MFSFKDIGFFWNRRKKKKRKRFIHFDVWVRHILLTEPSRKGLS